MFPRSLQGAAPTTATTSQPDVTEEETMVEGEERCKLTAPEYQKNCHFNFPFNYDRNLITRILSSPLKNHLKRLHIPFM